MHILPFVPKGLVYRDLEEKIRLESRNSAIQAGFVFQTVADWKKGDKVEPALLLKLQEIAVNQIYRCAGCFRDGVVILDGATHCPPEHTEVPKLIEEMCAYINANLYTRPAVHLAAYSMWRVNWIHPFFGGNGRTARSFSYFVLCIALGFTLPAGEKNIPEFITENRAPYYEALRRVDESCLSSGTVCLDAMEELISSLLAKQLLGVHGLATGKNYTEQDL